MTSSTEERIPTPEHLSTCKAHGNDGPSICFGHLKRRGKIATTYLGSCSNRATYQELNMMPTCRLHQKQLVPAMRCRALLPCGFECQIFCPWAPNSFNRCAPHVSCPGFTACYLLAIPIELRLRIYHYLLPDEDMPSHWPSRYTDHQRIHYSPYYLAVLRVNQQLHDETARYLYGSRQFAIGITHDGLGMCNSCPPVRGRSQHVQLVGKGNHALQDYQMQLMLLEQQNKKRAMAARQADAAAPDHTVASISSSTPGGDDPRNGYEAALSGLQQNERTRLGLPRGEFSAPVDHVLPGPTVDASDRSQCRLAKHDIIMHDVRDLAPGLETPVISPNSGPPLVPQVPLFNSSHASSYKRSQPPPVPSHSVWSPPISLQYFKLIQSFCIDITFPDLYPPTLTSQNPTCKNALRDPHTLTTEEDQTIKAHHQNYEFLTHAHHLITLLQQSHPRISCLEIIIRFPSIRKRRDRPISPLTLATIDLVLRPFKRLCNIGHAQVKSVIVSDEYAYPYGHCDLLDNSLVGADPMLASRYEPWSKALCQPFPALVTGPVFSAYWKLEALTTKITQRCGLMLSILPPRLVQGFKDVPDLLHRARVAREDEDVVVFRDVFGIVVAMWSEFLEWERSYEEGIWRDIEGVWDGIGSVEEREDEQPGRESRKSVVNGKRKAV